ncbi:MAG: response regulator transcription factor [Burkholderiaceae bacterium]|nr:MAG: response regulator transcription factor [Burkholderiaceae bacterium]
MPATLETRTIKVIMVDDHALIRAGLRKFLEETGHIEVTAEASTGKEAIAQARANTFDVMLLDISLPDLSGMDVLRTVCNARPEMGVLMISGYPEEQYAMHALKAGALGFIGKDTAPAQMLQAIETVARGQRYVSPNLASQLALGLIKNTDKPLHTFLSEREFQVFTKLAAGRSPTEIAAELFLSVKTISTHRARILEKMNLKTNADLTYYAIKNGLIQ